MPDDETISYDVEEHAVRPVPGLRGVRVLVVGASSGVGRSLGAHAVASGARVVLAARRKDVVDEVVAEAGGGTAVAADVTDPASCRALADRCAVELGEVDLVLNAAGVSLLATMADTDGDDWARLLSANVVGFNHLAQAMLPVLSDRAVVLTFSSEAVDQPRSGLGAYGASKAALEAAVRSWQAECGPVRFACVALGATMPSGVSDEFDAELLDAMVQDWMVTGVMQTGVMSTDDVAWSLLGVLAAVLPVPGVNLQHLTVRSPTPLLGSWGASSPRG